jgi:hypothetical protein
LPVLYHAAILFSRAAAQAGWGEKRAAMGGVATIANAGKTPTMLGRRFGPRATF